MSQDTPAKDDGAPARRIVFITNFCPHYRVKTYEILANYYRVAYYFFSASDEWYWEQRHGKRAGQFEYEYLPGFKLGGTRITPTLVLQLLRRQYDVCVKCVNGRFALPATYVIARLRRKPFVLWTGIWMTLQTKFHRAVFPLTRYIYRHADAVVVYGEHVKRYLVEQGVSAERVFVCRHAVDNDKYSRPVPEDEVGRLRQTLDLAPSDRVILYLGRLEESKGLRYLIDAFAQLAHPDVVLVFVGQGSENAALRQQAGELGVQSRVRFAGYVPDEATLPYYAMSELLVLPSITTPQGKEPWGLVVNEAMNQGLPVVATDAVGAAAGGLVQDGVNGFVVPERDSAALTHALRRILDDSDLRNRFSQNARQVMTRWGQEDMVLAFRQAIEYAAGRR